MPYQPNTLREPNPARRDYPFEGGGELHTLGAGWFVSYMYHDLVDPQHVNWQNTRPKPLALRIHIYDKTKELLTRDGTRLLHLFWLDQVLQMGNKIASGQIGLSADQIRDLARRLQAILRAVDINAPPAGKQV